MLVLTRRRDEAIVIRNRFGTEIRLMSSKCGATKSGWDRSPPEVSIAREEVRQRESPVEACARELAWI